MQTCRCDEESYARIPDRHVVLGRARSPDGARWPDNAARAARHLAGSFGWPERSDEVADLRRRVQRPTAQPAHADHARERASTLGAVDVSDGPARELPDDTPRPR